MLESEPLHVSILLKSIMQRVRERGVESLGEPEPLAPAPAPAPADKQGQPAEPPTPAPAGDAALAGESPAGAAEAEAEAAGAGKALSMLAEAGRIAAAIKAVSKAAAGGTAGRRVTRAAPEQAGEDDWMSTNVSVNDEQMESFKKHLGDTHMNILRAPATDNNCLYRSTLYQIEQLPLAVRSMDAKKAAQHLRQQVYEYEKTEMENGNENIVHAIKTLWKVPDAIKQHLDGILNGEESSDVEVTSMVKVLDLDRQQIALVMHSPLYDASTEYKYLLTKTTEAEARLVVHLATVPFGWKSGVINHFDVLRPASEGVGAEGAGAEGAGGKRRRPREEAGGEGSGYEGAGAERKRPRGQAARAGGPK